MALSGRCERRRKTRANKHERRRKTRANKPERINPKNLLGELGRFVEVINLGLAGMLGKNREGFADSADDVIRGHA